MTDELTRKREVLEWLRPHSQDRALDIAALELEIDEDECREAYERARLAKSLFDAYRKTGSMVVQLPDGRMVGSPYISGCQPQDIWNVQSEARMLARHKVIHERRRA